MYDILQLNDMILPELQEVAEKLKIKGSDKLEKQELILKVLDAQALNPQSPTDIHTGYKWNSHFRPMPIYTKTIRFSRSINKRNFIEISQRVKICNQQ